jgi:cytochrome c oxidase subunit I+III
VVAHFHYVMVGGATAMFGGLYYWFPKITGKLYDRKLGLAHFAMYFFGFNLLYFPMFVVWETPRRVFEYTEGFTLWHRVATVGAFLLGASFLVFFYNMAKSIFSGAEAPDNPWEYSSSIEWSLPSPPPLENFPKGLPNFSSGRLDFLDDDEVAARASATADGGTAADGGTVTASSALATAEETGLAPVHAEVEEHADHASWWPLALAGSAFLTFLGLAGLQWEYFVWPGLFGIAFFVAFLGLVGARKDGYSIIHSAFVLSAIGGIMAILQLLAMDKGSLDAAFANASPYFYVTTIGVFLGAGSLVSMGWESFHSPEALLAERWPFSAVGKWKLGMWMFLASDIILFGAFVGSYLFLRVANGWRSWHELVPEAHTVLPGLINTYFLLASSFAVVIALEAAKRENRRALIGWLAATFALGVGFLVNKGIEWEHLFHLHEGAFEGGWAITTNVASSTFYLTTGLHGAHVIVGLLIALFLIVRAWQGAYMGEEESETVEYFGLYWHFVDIVWLFLFPLFYIL